MAVVLKLAGLPGGGGGGVAVQPNPVCIVDVVDGAPPGQHTRVQEEQEAEQLTSGISKRRPRDTYEAVTEKPPRAARGIRHAAEILMKN